MIHESLFSGYGFRIQRAEDIKYYYDCFSKEEQIQILEDKHNFVHLLSEKEIFIGWSFGRSLSKDAFLWAANHCTENFWDQWDEYFGDVKRPVGEPRFQSFLYEKWQLRAKDYIGHLENFIV